MNLHFAWIDFWWVDYLFGFGLLTINTGERSRSLLSIYWNDGELLIDLLWLRVYTGFPFNAVDTFNRMRGLK
ncbi:MAG: hypothetical protein V3U84_02730 [Thiotrichaceae bacterium]